MSAKLEFSIEKDNEIIGAGGFLCEGCFLGKPIEEQSDDPRYCYSCFKFLSDEAVILGIKSSKGKKVSWVPVPSRAETTPVVEERLKRLPDHKRIPSGVLQRPVVDLRASGGKIHRGQGVLL